MYIRLGISGSAFPATIHRLNIQNTRNANGSSVIQPHTRPFYNTGVDKRSWIAK
jgi:hypothetical protein